MRQPHVNEKTSAQKDKELFHFLSSGFTFLSFDSNFGPSPGKQPELQQPPPFLPKKQRNASKAAMATIESAMISFLSIFFPLCPSETGYSKRLEYPVSEGLFES
jgi:hypothetical protein